MKYRFFFRTGLMLILGAYTSSSFGQYEDYQLKDYTNPNYKRQELNFSINGSFRAPSSKVNNDDAYHWDKETGMSGTTYLNYNQVKNSVRVQNTTNAALQLDGGFSKGKAFSDKDSILSDNSSRDRNFQIGLFFSNAGYYYGQNKKFIVFAPEAQIGFRFNKYKFTDSEIDEKQSIDVSTSDKRTVNDFKSSASFRLGLGKGRIEEVGDAKQAIYILQDLQKQGVLKKRLSQEEITELAEVITRVKYKRQFDNRIRLIQEITTLDSLFIANGYVDKEHSAAYFTSLYDNWQYARENRRSGNRFAFGVEPGAGYNLNKKEAIDYKRFLYEGIEYADDESIIRDTTKLWNYGAKFYIQFESEKPINLHWQRMASVDLSYGRFNNGDNETDWKHNVTSLQLSYGLTYYLNSRTSVSGRISEMLYYRFEDDFNIDSRTNLNIRMIYYLSPQFRLNLDYSAYFDYFRDKKDGVLYTRQDKRPNHYASVTLTYSLF